MLESRKAVSHELRGDVVIAAFTEPRIVDKTQGDHAFKELEHLVRECATIGGKLLLNLSGVQFMSGCVLAQLVNFRKRASAYGVHLRLCAPSPLLSTTMSKAGLDAFFDIHPTREDALLAFKRIQHDGERSKQTVT